MSIPNHVNIQDMGVGFSNVEDSTVLPSITPPSHPSCISANLNSLHSFKPSGSCKAKCVNPFTTGVHTNVLTTSNINSPDRIIVEKYVSCYQYISMCSGHVYGPGMKGYVKGYGYQIRVEHSSLITREIIQLKSTQQSLSFQRKFCNENLYLHL